jgi:hypothetical protein
MAAASWREVVDSNLGRFFICRDRYRGRDSKKGKDDEERLGNEHALILRLVGFGAVLGCVALAAGLRMLSALVATDAAT